VNVAFFEAFGSAGIAALEGDQDGTLTSVYEARQSRTLAVLRELGWKDAKAPDATFYLWLPVPDGHTSVSFASRVLDDAGVNVTPGSGFGEHGEGYFRVSLTVPDDRLDEALERLRKISF
jgi:LL-diaminopimelate aminotransferase